MSASRTLQAAQRLYEGSSAGAVITYPRTRSQFLPADQIGGLKGIARGLAGIPRCGPRREYVAGLDVLPLARVVDDAKVDDHHAIIPTGELPDQEAAGRRRAGVRPRRAPLPGRVPSRGEVRGHRDHDRRRRAPVPHPRQAPDRGRLARRRLRRGGGGRGAAQGDEDEPRQVLPKVDEGERGTCEQAEVLEKQTKPPARYSEASLLRDMETAGKRSRTRSCATR